MTGVSAVTIDVLLAAATAVAADADADADGGHSNRQSWRTVRGADEALPVRRF
jgi:hypothetical protein